MPPKEKRLPIPPDSDSAVPRRERKEIKRFSDDQQAAPRQSTVKKESAAAIKTRAAEARLTEGSPKDRCAAVLEIMALRKDAYWFSHPVPLEHVPDYPDVIKTPCDYSTVRQRLEGGDYGDDAIAFAADMRLIYTNAVTYNWDPNHDCNKAARACLRTFEHYFMRSRGIETGPLEDDRPPPSGKSSGKGSGEAWALERAPGTPTATHPAAPLPPNPPLAPPPLPAPHSVVHGVGRQRGGQDQAQDAAGHAF